MRASTLQRLALVSVSIVPLVGCSTEHHDPYESKLGPPPRPAAPPIEEAIVVGPGPGVLDDGDIVFAVQWFEGTLDQALALAEDQNKLVFVDVGAYWCPPCHELDERVFTDPRIGVWLAANTIALHIDAEKGDGPELVERYAVQAYPTLLVLEASGVEKSRVVDFHEPDELLEMLATIAANGNVLAGLLAEVETAPDDLDARYRLGRAYALAAKRELAEAEFEIVLRGDAGNDAGLASKVLSDRATFFAYKLDANPEAAIAAFEDLQARYPRSKEAIRGYRAIGRAHCKQGREAKAVQALQAMIAADPDVSFKSSYGWFSFREKCGVANGLAAVLSGIAQAPDDADLRYVEAELQRMLGEPDLALAAIREAARIEPKSAFYKRQVRRFEAIAQGELDPNDDGHAAPVQAEPAETSTETSG